uniref:Serine/threonine-protein phosphatase 7 long form-like n=1 Tax=Vitis vinifera TaxID=29760 RepID=A5BLK1_VITVI|nr:hypothetical protein VITISV_039102 [Vitis vinifera]
MKVLLSKGKLLGLKSVEHSLYEGCIFGKQKKTWQLTELPKGKKALNDNKWVYRVKEHNGSEVCVLKAQEFTYEKNHSYERLFLWIWNLLWSWERLHVGRPSRALPHAPMPIDERFQPDALGNRLYHEHYVALWEARGDHIVNTEPIEPHVDYHAPYMTWYHHITRRFITPMDDFGPMRYQTTTLSAHLLIETMTSIISRGGHALEDSASNVCHTGIVDIIHMATDVMCIFGKIIAHTSSDPPSTQLLTSSDLPSVQPPISLDLPPLQPSTSSDPPSVQIDTSTQLDLLPAIPRGRRGLHRPRLLPSPPPLFSAPTPS